MEYKGYTLEISQDIYSESPRDEVDNLATMAYFKGSRTSIGDVEWNIEDMRETLTSDKFISLPVYLYNHSGLAINTTGFSCPWDSGQCGIIFVSKEDVRKEWSKQRISKKLYNHILNCLRGEVETYNMYLQGDVWMYNIEDKDGNTKDSCIGFYGMDYCLEAAKESADYLALNP